MKLSPVQNLLFLVLLGLAVAGWIYGVHWKRIASGGSFTKEERMMISLQDQIAVLSEKNEELNKALREALAEEEEGQKDEKSAPQP